MLAIVFYLLFLLAAPPMASEAALSNTCCFVHPNYVGVCVVDPGPGESCASILNYLNSPGTVGKSYCGNTTIRGGWSQVRCE